MKRELFYIRLDELIDRFHPDNHKDHDIGQMVMSLVEFGFVETPVIDYSSGKLAAGHGRVEALWHMMKAGYEPPDGVIPDKDGMWTIPVIEGVELGSQEHTRAYLVASHRIAVLGGVIEDKLLASLESALEQGQHVLEAAGYEYEDMLNLARSEMERLDMGASMGATSGETESGAGDAAAASPTPDHEPTAIEPKHSINIVFEDRDQWAAAFQMLTFGQGPDATKFDGRLAVLTASRYYERWKALFEEGDRDRTH